MSNTNVPVLTQHQLADINNQIDAATNYAAANGTDIKSEKFAISISHVPLAAIVNDLDDEGKVKLALRQEVDRENPEYITLRNSINRNGLQTPITVRRHSATGGFIVIDGLHRWTACQELQIPAVNVNFLPNVNDIGSIIRLQIVGNAHRVKTKNFQFAKAIKRALALNPHWVNADAAKEFDVSVAWVGQLLGLANLPDDVGAMAENGEMTLVNGIQLAKLPKDEIPDWVDRAKNMTAVDFAAAVNSRLQTIQANNKGIVREWAPSPIMRKGGEIKDMFLLAGEKVSNINENDINPESPDYQYGYYAALAWAVKMDKESIDLQRANHDKIEAERMAKAGPKKSAPAPSMLNALGLKPVAITA